MSLLLLFSQGNPLAPIIPEPPFSTQNFIDYYTSLLIIQYASLGNAIGTVQALIGELVQDQIISQVRDGFDPDTAIGAQLDILASYRGLSRVVFGATIANFWSLIPYADPAPGTYFGWDTYTDTGEPSWQWLQYNDLNGVPYVLNDNQLRRLLKLRAAIQSSGGGLGELDNILYSVFGVYLNVKDNGNMSIIYQHIAVDPDPDKLYAIAVLAGVLPHDAGVAFSTVEV